MKLKETNFKKLRARPLIYLASPYSHPDKKVRHKRFKEVSKVAGDLITLLHGKAGLFCPIAHSVPIAKYSDIHDMSWIHWLDEDLTVLSACSDLFVLQIDGWKESKGVQAEIRFAKKHGIDITYIDKDLGIRNKKGDFANARI